MYKVPYSPPLGGKFIKPVGKEYQVLKEEREYHGCGEEYIVDKRKRGSKIIFPIILRLYERISSGEEGRRGNIWEENQDLKK